MSKDFEKAKKNLQKKVKQINKQKDAAIAKAKKQYLKPAEKFIKGNTKKGAKYVKKNPINAALIAVGGLFGLIFGTAAVTTGVTSLKYKKKK